MSTFLLNNTAGRNHKALFGPNAIFDLSPDQHGWKAFQAIIPGSVVYIINMRRHIPVAHLISNVQMLNGDLVIFGKPIKRIDSGYSKFIKDNGILNSRINSDYKMTIGFNCVAFIRPTDCST